ncbi:MAG: class I SAM-dependent methyltransferase [Oscillospiraceae bacterium]|nr:class I SAM-dependent methyltransferase [Oscillospiraceae bacterium]
MELYVWGTGCSAGELTAQGLDAARVTAFVDSSPVGERFLGRPVIRPEELAGRSPDLILVASAHSDEIAARAEALGIPADKLFFLKNNWRLQDRNSDYAAAAALLGGALIERLRVPHRVVREPLWAADSALETKDLESDYVRVRSLEAVCRQIGDLPGAAAELGVYRGAFASCINRLLPERTLYLFDTFEGFDRQETAGEAAGFVEAHRNTSVEAVRARMPHPERVVLMRGLFPASLNGLEERFAFVSLDVDLEESTLAGLRYFYPRLVPGGYLFLHDHGSPALPGVERALRRYEQEWGMRLPAVPICDINGTMILCKV